MNVVYILNTLGYEVLRHNHDKMVYLVRKIPLRAKRDGDKRINEVKLKIKDVGFDRDGDFYVIFNEYYTNREHDVYWYRNMTETQIYDIDFDTVDDEHERELKNIQGQREEWTIKGNSIFRNIF